MSSNCCKFLYVCIYYVLYQCNELLNLECESKLQILLKTIFYLIFIFTLNQTQFACIEDIFVKVYGNVIIKKGKSFNVLEKTDRCKRHNKILCYRAIYILKLNVRKFTQLCSRKFLQ